MDGKRKMQPFTTRGEDIAAAQAEAYVCQMLGAQFNNSDGADPGWDFEFAGLKVDVKWVLPKSKGANLIVKAQRVKGKPVWEPRFPQTDVYVLVTGEPGAFEVVGWAWREQVVAEAHRYDRPVRPGDNPYFLYPRERLNSTHELLQLAQLSEDNK